MMFAKLSDNNSDRGMFKSFQPPSNDAMTKMNSMISNMGSGNKNKKKELFRSNVEPTNSSSGGGFTGLYFGFYQNLQLSHKDYLNDSIKSSSHDEESIAEERNTFVPIHKTSINTAQSSSV